MSVEAHSAYRMQSSDTKASIIDAPDAWFLHAAPVDVVCADTADTVVDVTAGVVPELKVGVDAPAAGVVPEVVVGVELTRVDEGVSEGA
jgi:hypothetical protein